LKLQSELIELDPEEALRRLEADTKTLIKPADFQSDLASTYGARGVILAELGRPKEAEAEHEEALAILDQLTVENPGVPKYQGERAWTLTHLGAIRGSVGDLKQADEVFRRLVGDHPNVTRFRAGAARNKAARGEWLVRAGSPTGKPDEGLELLRQAREELDSLVRENPQNFDYRSDLRRIEELLPR
jgi:tetratricopeptide (TPR) repeat protein